jgi:hypothetical protein
MEPVALQVPADGLYSSALAGAAVSLLLAGGMVLAWRRWDRRQPAGPRTAAGE